MISAPQTADEDKRPASDERQPAPDVKFDRVPAEEKAKTAPLEIQRQGRVTGPHIASPR